MTKHANIAIRSELYCKESGYFVKKFTQSLDAFGFIHYLCTDLSHGRILLDGLSKLGSFTFLGGAFVIFPPRSTKISAGETMSNETTKNYVKSITTFDFPGCKCLVICGDIHGDFNMLVNKVCVQHQLKDALVIVAGDCGFGFERKGYYESTFNRNNKRMREANNWIMFMRGNHDNPAYFDGKTIAYKRFMAIPDYSLVKANGHTILCVGGAISVDRVYRIKSWNRIVMNQRQFGHYHDEHDPLAPNYYWKDEPPVFNDELLTHILAENTIDTVITHTAPSFCELKSKAGINSWIREDPNLVADLDHERSIMDAIYSKVKDSTVSHWCYGHFHQSWHADINGILFKMLDIMEFYEIR